MKLQELEKKYEELGKEIEKLKAQNYKTRIELPKVANGLDILFADKQMSWEEAKSWCEAQGGRLPTKIELQLIAASKQVPEDRRRFYYWSSDEASDWTGFAWNVNLNYGDTYYVDKTFTNAVLCVAGP